MSILPEFQAWLEAERARGLQLVRVPGNRPGSLSFIDLSHAEGIKIGHDGLSEQSQRAILAAEQAIASGNVRPTLTAA